MENQIQNSTPLNQSITILSFKDIFLSSLTRFKKRLFPYFGILFLTLIPIAISGIIIAFTSVINKSFLIVSSILVFPFLTYFISWFTLASVNVLISESKIKESLNTTKPIVFKSLWFFILSLVFIVGLIPLGLLSFFIIIYLWYFWGLFSIFILIEKQEKGLKNLWISKQLVSQYFWKIIGFSVLFGIIGIGLSLITFGIAGLFLNIFYLCFTYEIYKRIDKPIPIKTSIMWVWFSIFGWIIFIFLGIFIVINFNKVRPYISQSFSNKYYKKSISEGVDQNVSLNEYLNSDYLLFKSLPPPKGWSVDKFDAKNGTFTYKNTNSCKLSLHQIKIQVGRYSSNKEYSDLFFSKLIEPKTNNITNKGDYEVLISDYKNTNNYLFKGLKYNFISESNNKFTEVLISYIKNETALMIFLSCKAENWDENSIRTTLNEIEVSDSI